MRKWILALLLACCVGTAFGQASSPTPILPNTVMWSPSPIDPAVLSAWFIGGPESRGMYALRVKIASGTKLPPHTHPDERLIVVLSGTIYVGFGETIDESKVVVIPEGGMYVVASGVSHYVWAKDGDATYQESGVGPTGTVFIKH